ncbi:hypothetical protein [Okeania sp. KiyG1]|uniref:hypothetical protein n=1 Tax=Okeania sp. KiyG1 TaxID=2720165 RepID=UPI00192081EE|nr:hypothetical protein [Okeania sp. KiyG1]
MEEGRWKKKDGRRKMEDGRWKMEDEEKEKVFRSIIITNYPDMILINFSLLPVVYSLFPIP